MNYFFKYYRTNFYFEKAIKYNELFFSQNEELNDPFDLKVNYVFEDNVQIWKDVLFNEKGTNERTPDFWYLSKFFDISNINLLNRLNNLFKGKKINGISSLKKLLNDKKNDVVSIFTEFELENENKQRNLAKATLITVLTKKLTYAINLKISSVSFTTDALNSLMWAHYADGFKGCVVIYKAKEDQTIDLKHHYLSMDASPYKFEKVNYSDHEKDVSLLESSINKENLIKACITKNSFWTYEQEYRLLTAVETEPLHMIAQEKEIPSLRDRVLYHNPDAIAGIIFGPRFNQNYIDKIQIILSDNQFYGNNSSYFIFSTELRPNGNIKISEGKEIRPKLDKQLQESHKGTRLNKILAAMNIQNE